MENRRRKNKASCKWLQFIPYWDQHKLCRKKSKNWLLLTICKIPQIWHRWHAGSRQRVRDKYVGGHPILHKHYPKFQQGKALCTKVRKSQLKPADTDLYRGLADKFQLYLCKVFFITCEHAAINRSNISSWHDVTWDLIKVQEQCPHDLQCKMLM